MNLSHERYKMMQAARRFPDALVGYFKAVWEELEMRPRGRSPPMDHPSPSLTPSRFDCSASLARQSASSSF